MQEIDQLEKASAANDYHHGLVDKIAAATNLSTLALYTRLLFLKKISHSAYRQVKQHQQQGMAEAEARLKLEREMREAAGEKPQGRAAKPIVSPLLEQTLQAAYHRGVVEETEVASQLNLTPEKLYQLLE